MSLNIKLDSNCVKEDVSCHMLPCKIKLNGFCKVSKYFTPYIRDDKNVLTSSLRGYPLEGQKVKVPEGYRGVILRENKYISSEERELKATGSFNEFISWNWDKNPSADDKLMRALQWVEVASVLHKPVSEEDSIKSEKSPIKQKKRKYSE